jgi:threonine dehydrogenase-like Zn-dependent dehydrogenase
MKAVTWHGKRDVRVDRVPDPAIQEPNDAISKVTSTGICGSDLHLYEMLGPFMSEGDIIGHEPIGEVIEVGPGINTLRTADRVVVPFQIACGHCFMCVEGLMSQCETTQVREYGMGAAMFGYTKLYGSVPGGQAEFLRVPEAHFGPIKIPEGPPDERFVYLSDLLPTAYQAVRYAALPSGGTLAVLGLGAIGEMAARIALRRGAERVIGVDLVPERIDRARDHGVEALNARDGDMADVVRDITKGRGPDAVIDAVGMEAQGPPFGKYSQQLTTVLPNGVAAKLMEKLSVDRLGGLHAAIDMVRRGGTVSVVGDYAGMVDPVPMLVLFDKQVQIRMGRANVRRWVDDIMPMLAEDDVLGVDSFATHHLPLDRAPEAYEMFQKKRDGAVKILLNP